MSGIGRQQGELHDLQTDANYTSSMGRSGGAVCLTCILHTRANAMLPAFGQSAPTYLHTRTGCTLSLVAQV